MGKSTTTKRLKPLFSDDESSNTPVIYSFSNAYNTNNNYNNSGNNNSNSGSLVKSRSFLSSSNR